MGTRGLSKGLAAALLFAAVWSPTPAGANKGQISRATGAQPNGATPATSVPDQTSPALALDGLVIGFSSDATNLVTGDTNGVADVFVRDLVKGRLTRVSVTPNGGQANGASWDPAISVDGRYVAFVSKATNIVAGDANGFADVFVRDMKTRATKLVSVGPANVQTNGDSSAPFISLFGRWITFQTTASNINLDDVNGIADAYIRDTTAKTTTWIEPPEFDQTQSLANQAVYVPVPLKVYTDHAQVSYDGRVVTFTRGVQGRTPTTPAALDTYYLDRRTRKLKVIPSPPYAGRLPTGHAVVCRPMSDHAALSADGRYVAFESWSGCGVPPSDADRHATIKNPVANTMIYRFDPVHPQGLALVSLNSWGVAATGGGPQGTGGDNLAPSIAANGQVIAFQSSAVNLVPGDTNGKTDVFVRDLGARTTSRMSVSNTQTELDGESVRPSLSYEGRRVAFASAATNVVTDDTNLAGDIFMQDRLNFYPNKTPALVQPFSGERKVDALTPMTLRLRASDRDRDPIRYGLLAWRSSLQGKQWQFIGSPDNATVDPITGVFSWTPQPPSSADAQHNNACMWCQVKIEIVFWAGDPRGNSDVKLAEFIVRNAQATARCKILNQCDA